MYQLVRAREQSPFSERHCRALLSSNAACIQRMELTQRLEGHDGCVNTVSFDTEAGNILISGSDDLQIILWDWESGTSRLTFSSGHSNNVFQARMLPHSGGSRIVTCAADGQVRLCELPQGAGSASVSKSLLGQHYSRAHKLAQDPLCPAHCFYSCGEDGLVMHYDLRCGTGSPDASHTRARGGSSSSSSNGPGGSSRSGARRKLLACRGYTRARGITREVVGINAIHVNPMCPFHFALAAADPWVRVYDVRRTRDESQDSIGPPTRDQARSRASALSDTPVALLCPAHLAHGASPGSLLGDPHVTCVMYSKQGELLASYNDEDIYLFSAQAARGSGSAAGGGGGGGGGGSSSGAGARSSQQADTAAGQQQQQQQAMPQSAKSLSPSRRPREAAGEGAAAAAAAGGGGSTAAAAAPGVRYVLEEDEEERPRWRRRQRLVTTDEAAAAAAAAAAAGGGPPASQQTPGLQQQQQQEQEQEPQQEPPPQSQQQQQQQQQGANLLPGQSASGAAPAQQPPDLPQVATTAAEQPTTAAEAPSDIAAAPAGAVEHTAGAGAAAAAAAGGGSSFHLPEGLSGYEAVMGGRFYDADSTSRDAVVASYYGHRNSATVKGVSFFGEDDEYVCSGSDCGHVFLWDKARGSVVWWEEGDTEVVNCLEPHPRLPLLLATSGIEHDIKVWGPTAPGPLPPPAAALRRAMAVNQRERQSTRNAYSEPEHWLLQLLAAQRRRATAVRRRQAAAAEAAAAAGAPGVDGQPATAAATAAAAAAAAEEEGTTDDEGPVLLPPGGVRIVWGGGRRGVRRRGGQGEGAAGEQEEDEGALSSSEDEEGDMDGEEDDDGSENCQIS